MHICSISMWCLCARMWVSPLELQYVTEWFNVSGIKKGFSESSDKFASHSVKVWGLWQPQFSIMIFSKGLGMANHKKHSKRNPFFPSHIEGLLFRDFEVKSDPTDLEGVHTFSKTKTMNEEDVGALCSQLNMDIIVSNSRTDNNIITVVRSIDSTGLPNSP